MPTDRKPDPIKRRRLRHAERKLEEARRQLARTERSIAYWSGILADLKHERMRAIQPPLWPEEESGSRNGAGGKEWSTFRPPEVTSRQDPNLYSFFVVTESREPLPPSGRVEDPGEKLEAIEAVVPPNLRKGRFRPPDKLIALLKAEF